MTDPTNRELMIQLNAVIQQLDVVSKRLDSVTETMASSYVPRGEYGEARKADDRRMSEVEKDIEAMASFRRQIAAGGLLLLLGLVANLVVAIGGRVPGGGS